MAADEVLELHVCQAVPGMTALMGTELHAFHMFRCLILTRRPMWHRNQRLHFPQVQSS